MNRGGEQPSLTVPRLGEELQAPSQPAGRRNAWLLAGAILAATLLAYAPALRSGFIWDDDSFLTDNSLIHAQDGLRRFWLTTQPPDYFPLTSSMLWVEWRLWGKDHAAGYHLVNVLLHATSAILLWRLLLALEVPGAWLAGLVFALHPVNVESVAWITERKNVLPMVFYLLTLLAYLRFEERGSWRWYGAALLSFLLGLLAKTSIVMLPLVLLGWACWQRGKISRRDLLRTAPFFALSLCLGLVTVWYQTQRAIGSEIVRSDGLASRLAVAGWGVWFYLYKAVLPIHLSFVYPRWSVDPQSLVAWLPLAALLAVLTVLVAYRRHPGARTLLFCLGYYLLMLLPVLGFVDIYFMRYSLVADHWQYFSIPGVIVLACAALGRWQQRISRPILCQATAAGLAVALAGLTFQQSRIYANTETLWNDTLEKNPACWLAQNDLAKTLLKLGRSDQAIQHCREALRLQPNYPEAHYNLGIVLQRMGRLDEAAARYREALWLNPNDSETHYRLGTILQKLGPTDQAIHHYQEALWLKPDYAEAHNNLGNTLQGLGRLKEAMAHYQEALRLKPEYAEAHNNWGFALQSMGRFEEAVVHYKDALRLKPEFVETYNNLGLGLQSLGHPDEAAIYYQEALRRKPDYLEAHYNLGNAQRDLGQTDQAIQQYQETLRLKPDSAPAHNNLGAILAQRGQLREAAAQFRAALAAEPDNASAKKNLSDLNELQNRHPKLRLAPQPDR